MIKSRVVTTGHLRLITGGDPDAAHPWQDTPHTAATVCVPEAFTAACRCTTVIPWRVDVYGIAVTIVPSRRVAESVIDVGLDAWEMFRRTVLAATNESRSDIGHGHYPLPSQITAAYWRAAGRDLRVTADRIPLGWMVPRLRSPGGDVG